MKRKKYKKDDSQARDSKTPTTAPKEQRKFLPIISYIYSVVLTLITLYTWFPTFTVDPQTMYFDGDHDTLQFIIKNNSVIPAHLVATIIDLQALKIDDSSFSNIRQTIHDETLLFSNKPRTIHFKVFKIGLRPIREIKESGLKFDISYRLPFVPLTFTEEHEFTAVKDSQNSVKWLHK